MSKESGEQKVPIRGWLILIAIAVWGSAVWGTLNIIINLMELFMKIHSTTTLPVRVIALVRSGVSIYLFALLVNRKRIFVTWSVWFLTIAFIYSIYFAVNGPVFTPVHNKVSQYADIVYGGLYVISILYLVRSKRVKRTFVK